jgi:hypothetical protein
MMKQRFTCACHVTALYAPTDRCKSADTIDIVTALHSQAIQWDHLQLYRAVGMTGNFCSTRMRGLISVSGCEQYNTNRVNKTWIDNMAGEDANDVLSLAGRRGRGVQAIAPVASSDRPPPPRSAWDGDGTLPFGLTCHAPTASFPVLPARAVFALFSVQ